MDNVNFHGEVVIKKVKMSLPKGSKKLNPKNGQYKIADSETTGNFHLLEAKDSVEVYEKDGILYAKSNENIKVTCVDKSRHDTQTLEPTTNDELFVISPAQEYDHLLQEKRNVAD